MSKARQAQTAGATIVVALALALGGCGSSSSSSASAKGVAIDTAHSSAGVYLTGANGRALYLWVADSNDKSVCSGACAQAWPPVLTTATPSAGSGVTAGDLGMITRAGGQKQVTYKGHPLYYFVGDRSAGTVHGQGSDSFGAKWWLVTPAGAAITTGGSSSAPSGGSSSGSSTSSGGGWG
jgi:predicted lipoprotein with Yx(FWY)xxD motif